MEIIATSVKEAAKALSIGRTSIYALIREGKLETVKLGRRTLITTASIHALMGHNGAAKADCIADVYRRTQTNGLPARGREVANG